MIIFDGIRVYDYDFLYGMKLNQIEGIDIDKTGFGMNAGSVIRIFSRRTPLNKNSKIKGEEYAYFMNANAGFSQAKTFYTPYYRSYTSDFFSDYGVIGWFPNITLINNNSQLLKVLNTTRKKITFYIEGYDSENNLISQTISLEK